MKIMFVFALLLAVSTASADQTEQVISVQHDSQRGVTCWILNDSAISCLPDSSLLQATPSSEAARASPASTALKNGSLVATSLPQDERFKL